MRKREKFAIIKRFFKSGDLHNAVELINVAFDCKMYIQDVYAPYRLSRKHKN